MRTTIDLPEDLFRQAKAHAALRGKSLKDLVGDALRLLLGSSAKPAGPAELHHARFPILIKAKGAASERLAAADGAEPTPAAQIPMRKRTSAGAWAKRFAGIAKLAPGETTDAARAAHYREKYGV